MDWKYNLDQSTIDIWINSQYIVQFASRLQFESKLQFVSQLQCVSKLQFTARVQFESKLQFTSKLQFMYQNENVTKSYKKTVFNLLCPTFKKEKSVTWMSLGNGWWWLGKLPIVL